MVTADSSSQCRPGDPRVLGSARWPGAAVVLPTALVDDVTALTADAQATAEQGQIRPDLDIEPLTRSTPSKPPSVSLGPFIAVLDIVEV